MKKISEILSERRTELGLSIQQVSKDTKIPSTHIINIENGEWKNFASTVFAQVVVQKYANYLRCDSKKISALLRRELVADQTNFILRSSYKEKTSFISHQAIFFAFLIIFIGYFILQIFLFVRKPPLRLQSIPAFIKTSQPLVIQGMTEKGALVYLNDERVYQNSDGVFREEMYLKKGQRTIVIKVVGTNGTIISKTVTLTVTN